MLSFFRKNQRIFFLFITVVIIVTFVFFGTYNVLAPTQVHDETAFEALDGKTVKSSYLDEMARFLSADGAEAFLKNHMQKSYPGNFLNDGVVVKDFLQTGMAQVIFQYFFQELTPDLQTRLEKEKHFATYKHPYAQFITAESVWESFAPELRSQLDVLRASQDASLQESFDARVNLYLQERQFPPAFLRQVLLYQQKQYDWLPPDQALMQDNLSLFGYRDLNDWFGSTFVKLMSQVIINSAAIAKERGYKVSSEEVVTDLLAQSGQAFERLKGSANMHAKNGQELLQEYLRASQIDESRLINIWQDLLLFRRLFNDIGSSVIVDALALQDFNHYARQGAEIELYTLPVEFNFKDFHVLQLFEVYLDAIAQQNREPLLLPTSFKTVDELEKIAPQLVEKRFWVEIGSVNKNQLLAKVGIKETWDWELQDENWEALKKQFPELALNPAQDDQARFQVLEALDPKTRNLVDHFARETLADAHPEWKQYAMDIAPTHEEILAIGESCSLTGITDTKKLLAYLEAQPLDETFDYTQDETNFYQLRIKERATAKNVLTFREALDKGILGKMLKNVLEKEPEYGESVLTAIQNECKKNGISLEATQKNELASYRFADYMRTQQKEILKESVETVSTSEDQARSILDRPPIALQWKLNTKKEVVNRSNPSTLCFEEVMSSSPLGFSKIALLEERGLCFYQFLNKIEEIEDLAPQISHYRTMLASEAKCNALRDFLARMQNSQAITLRAP